MTWIVKRSIAHGPGGGDRYVYGICNVEDDREVAHYFNQREAENVLKLMQHAYNKGEQSSTRHVPLVFVLSLVVLFLIFVLAYKSTHS